MRLYCLDDVYAKLNVSDEVQNVGENKMYRFLLLQLEIH